MDQNTTITKASAVFAFFTFEYWFHAMWQEYETDQINDGDVIRKFDILTKHENKKHLVYDHTESFP